MNLLYHHLWRCSYLICFITIYVYLVYEYYIAGEKEYSQEELIKLIYKRASVMYEMSDYKEEIEKIDITSLDKFIVYKNGKIKIKLKNGVEIEEKI